MDVFDGDSEYEGYTETSDTDDQDDIESSYGGQAQSILSNLDDSIGRIDDYLAFERGFVHGDVVCSVKDPSGQMGRVMDLDMIVDLESTNGEIIKEVNSKKLCKIRSFGEGDYVVNGPWLGRVVRVYDLVSVLLDDGTKCKISTRDQDTLVPISVSSFEEGPCIYHLGQRVKINYSVSFKSPRWFCGTWTADPSEGTVCKVEVGSVVVNWVASVLAASSTAPPRLQNAENLTLLSCFPHANWQLGDWCMLSPDYFQSPSTAEEQAFPSIIPGCVEMKKLRMKESSCEQIFVITKTKTKVDILWQDGNRTPGLELQTLSPINTIGDHDFWPGQFVQEKALSEDVQNVHVQRFGIVRNVHAEERLVKVTWVAPELGCTTDRKRVDDEETVSAYEVVEHPDHSYCLGDVVFRTLPHFEGSKETLIDQEDMHNEMHGYPPFGPGHCSLEHLGNNNLMKDHTFGDCSNYAFCYQSCIGNVTGFKNGGIEVRWASGITSKVEPSEVFGIEKFDVTTTTPLIHGEAIEGAFIQEMSDLEGPLSQKKEKELDINDSGEGCMKNLFASNPLWFPPATIGFIMNFVASYFGFHGSSSLSNDYIDGIDRNHNSYWESLDLENTQGFDQLEKLPVEPILKMADVDVQVPRQMNLDIVLPMNVNKIFKKFDTVDDYSDHHFVGVSGKDFMLSQVKRSWFKKVQQEWSILEKDLPDTICVRVYERRMDLLRASIVGAAGTPYQDALFFFDICFPLEYPHEPPMVYYISGGLRLNPNLYESGRVCLSLLKTWTGTGTEVWNPESSTILQVLLSLQALVLNDKPYFNEAGYDKQIGRAEGEKNSITYNENAFLLSRKSMLYQLHKSPKNFEELVEEHFASRSHQILHACKAYIEGTQVGDDFTCRDLTAEAQKTTSTGFKIMLSKLFPKLVSAFAERGINCSQFLDQMGYATLVPEPGNDFS